MKYFSPEGGTRKKMYIYNIGYDGYEYCHRVQFWHEDKMSYRQFRSIVIDCIINVLQNAAASKHDCDAISYTFGDVMYGIEFEEAMTLYGFIKVKFQAEFVVWERDTCVGKQKSKSSTVGHEYIVKKVTEGLKKRGIIRKWISWGYPDRLKKRRRLCYRSARNR